MGFNTRLRYASIELNDAMVATRYHKPLFICLFLLLMLLPAWSSAALQEKIVFSKQKASENYDLWVMNPDGSNKVQLTNLSGYEGSPKISPDGTKIAFISDASGKNEVHVMNVDGTNIRQLTSGSKPYIQLAWHPSGTKLYYDSVLQPYDAAIRSVNIDGTGDTEVINHAGYHDAEMDISPDGNYLVYIYEQCCWTPSRSIRLRNLSNGSDIELLSNDSYSDFNPRFSPDGNYIIWQKHRSTDPYAFGHDIWRMKKDGSSRVNLTGAHPSLAFGYASYSRDGNKIVSTGYTNGGDSNIYIMNADGSGLQQLTTDTTVESYPDFGAIDIKPTNKIVYHSNQSGNSDIWTMDEQGGNKVQLTNSAANESQPKWSKDGQKIVYTSDVSGNDDIWVMNSDGSGKTQLTTNTAGDNQSIWTPDGTKILFFSYRNGGRDIYIMDSNGANQKRLTTVNGLTGGNGIGISPDGAKIAYTSQPSGGNWGYNSELYSATLTCSGNAATCSISNALKIASFDSQTDFTPSFTPDGKILWSSGRNNPYGQCASNCYFTTQEIYRINTDGTGEVKITSNTVTSDVQPVSSTDGSKIIFSSDRASGSANVANTYDLWIVNSDGTGLTQLTNTTGYSEGGADWWGTATADSTLSQGLVANYPFNGNASDESGNGHNGTVNGATATADRFGNANAALSFDGSTSYVDLGVLAPVLAGQGQGSISLWFKRDPYSGSYSNPWDVLFDSVSTSGSTGLYVGDIGSNLYNESMSFFYPGVDGGYINGHGFYFDSKWHHVVVEMGSNFNALYVDGSKLPLTYGWSGNETTGNVMWGGLTQLTIGRQPGDSYFFKGAMDDIRIYNRALSASEVAQLYTPGSAVPTSYNLTVNKSGTGAGSVTANTGTVTWSGNTGTATYNNGISVTLTATPDTGSTFAGWSGDCSGTGTCMLNMLGVRNVTATFNLIPIDTTPPTNASIVINSGAVTTGSQQVTLTLAATDPSGMGQMKFSNDNSTWSNPIPFANTAVWSLTSGNELKTVYAKFSDSIGIGNWMTTPVSAAITLAVTVVPQNPTGLEITDSSSDSVTLRWNMNAEAGITYDVFRSETEGGLFYRVNTNSIGMESISFGKVYFTDKELREGVTYYYKIQASLSSVPSTGLSDAASDSTLVVDDYIVNIADSTNIVNVGGTVKYYLQLLPKDKFQGSVNLSCSGISANLVPEFIVNDQSRGASASGVTLPASVVLKVSVGSAAQVKEHTFQLLTQNVWSGGLSDLRSAPLTLVVIPRDGAGIHMELEKSVFRMGEKMKLYGSILPVQTGKVITLTLTKGTNVQTKTIVTTAGGKFQDPDLLSMLGIGTYSITAAWVDESSNTHTSIVRTFTVEKGGAVLTCLRRTGDIPGVNKDFTVQGSMQPAIPYAPMIMRLYAPDGNSADRSFSLDGDGQYQISDKFFTNKGLWKFKIYFMGNDQYIGAESDLLVVPVEVEAGRAIILGGGVADQTNTYWAVTKKLIADAYKDFKSKGFTDEMIWLMINSTGIDINNDLNDDPVVDVNLPTVDAFLEALRNKYVSQLNTDTPLFIYMFGHGTDDGRFKVLGDDQYVNAAQMKAALDQLQGATGCPVVVVLESCYSGTFLQGLVSTNGYKRIILTSADNRPYQIDDMGRNAFSRFLFAKLKEGDDVRKAFIYARTTLVNMGYPVPQFDDGASGTLAANTYLRGELTMGLKPVISELNVPLTLDGVSSTPVSVSVTRGDVATETVWVQVIAPTAAIIGQEGTLSYPRFSMGLNSATGKYEGTIGGLSSSGVYKLVAFAQDVNKEVSDPVMAYITVASPPMPGDVNGDGNVTLADAILTLRAASGLPLSAGSIRPDFAAADVNGDNKIGLAEAIYILQKAAGLR